MASASASTSIDTKKGKPSFAKVSGAPATSASVEEMSANAHVKIAAAGIKSSNAQQNSSNHPSDNQKNEAPPPAHDGATTVTPLNMNTPAYIAPKAKKLVTHASKEIGPTDDTSTNNPEVRVQAVESAAQQPSRAVPDGLLAPAPDDVGTQVSSSSDSNKPPSLDGKSVASGTTFALDEKESLRPDDSASVKAADEDDMGSTLGSGLPGSRIGSDDGVRAFRDQLREISSMEPSRRGQPPPGYGNVPKGVLYVPPQSFGIGSVPNAVQGPPAIEPNTDPLPDQKLLEALENPRDRVWVLKLEQDVIDFVKDPKESSLTLPQCHSFYRLLAHKMADYYMLGHLVEDTAAAVRLYKTPNCRIPPPLTGITAPSTAASTPPPSAPQMKILRRGVDRAGPAIANGSNMPSKSGSENGDSGDDERKPKAPVSREEREARYEAARLRIMGSAKPNDLAEAPKEKHDSRSSSTTGKKNKKKQRADSDDGFEARSAYSNYYNPTYTTGAQPAASTQAFAEVSDAGGNHFAAIYGQQSQPAGIPLATTQGYATMPWYQQAPQHTDPAQAWMHDQNSAYDLSAQFQRAMSFSNQEASQGPGMNYDANYSQQYYMPQQTWPAQHYPMPSQMSPTGYGFPPDYSHSSMPARQEQPYAYGQLPSQAFPGRPPSKSEHPLPGSYKSKHFNPQSQSFVPSPTNGRPFTPQGAPAMHATNVAYSSGYASPQLQRQSSAHSQASNFGSPQHSSPHMQSRLHGQPMVHPLPHGPVFPRQPSPNLPLPPKPGTTSQRSGEQLMGSPNTPTMHNQSVIAKWGTPASLPAKPPPAAEPYDAAKISHAQRQPFANASAHARPSPGYAAVGATPSPGHGQIVNGSGAAGSKRP